MGLRVILPVLWLLPLACSTSRSTNREPLVFKKDGHALRQMKLEEIETLQQATTVAVREPHEQRRMTFKSVKLPPLLDIAYGTRWRSADQLLFICLDGYQQPIPVTDIVTKTPYLAYAKTGAQSFSVHDPAKDKDVKLGPYYLVWGKASRPSEELMGAYWPYQVSQIDLIDFASLYPRTLPPQNASASAQRGFKAFSQRCIACHTINGQGGGVSIELNYPVSVVELFKPEWLAKWIRNPRAIRYNTAMPPLPAQDDQQTLEDIVAYLGAMSGAKQAPDGAPHTSQHRRLPPEGKAQRASERRRVGGS